MGLTKVVPFLVEDELKAKGGLYSKGADLEPYVVSDGFLITGQNPKSSALAAKFLIDQPRHDGGLNRSASWEAALASHGVLPGGRVTRHLGSGSC